MVDERPYNSVGICRATGLSQHTFDAWLLRGILPLPPGPGTGRSRDYSALDAVRIGVAVEMTRAGISPSAAARICGNIHLPLFQPRTALLLVGTAPIKADSAERTPAWAIVRFASFTEIADTLRMNFVGGPPPTFTMMDVTAVAERVLARLADPDADPVLRTWLSDDHASGSAELT
jgi:MerR HTH family regulatory protein